MATLSDMKPSFLELSPEERLDLIHETRIERRRRPEKKVRKPRKAVVPTNSKPKRPKYDISLVSNEMLLEAAKRRGLGT